MADDFRYWGRPDQLPPAGDWRTWLFLGGRGAGKTRAGAEWVSARARTGKSRSIALIGPTFHDVREVMIEGVSGIRALPGVRPAYEASRRRLIWPNGAVAYCFSAEDPESLRGPQFDCAWLDEVCFWAHPERTLETLRHGMRLGARPLIMATTTPRPSAALKRLMAARDSVVTRARTFDNEALSPDFIAALEERFTGSAHERQELFGELVESFEGALWRRGEIDALRVRAAPPLDRIVVAVDPPLSHGPNADACGIVAAGVLDRHAYVLADASVQGEAPHVWAARAAALAATVGAAEIIAEANGGGELVRAMLKLAAPDAHVRLVYAAQSKRLRAGPVASLYAQSRVHHVGSFPALEDEMCAFGAELGRKSPDRVDALVWALHDLLLRDAQPRVRALF